MRRIVVKLGTQLVCRGGALASEVIADYAGVARQLADQDYAVIFVSSGAVAAGREALGDALREADEVSRRQVYSAAGQTSLAAAWRSALQDQKLQAAQVLATRSDFRDRGHYLNMLRCLDAMLAHRIVPIVNENDTVAVTELMFTDNDELAGLIAAMLGADRLLLLTNVDGVLNGGALIDEVGAGERPPVDGAGAPGPFGRGGMASKIDAAREAAALGVETWIANGSDPKRVVSLARGEGRGTRFVASQRPSSVKRWVASARGHEKGRAVVNEGAVHALTGGDAQASVLPVGVTRITGDFAKGDLIRIEDVDGRLLGYGKAQYGSATARRYLGRRGRRALVHRNYLYLVQ